MNRYNGVLTILGLASFFLCFVFRQKLNFLFLFPFHYYVLVCILPGKAISEMTYTPILCRAGR